jgi:uncharacterized membrane protein YdbT with pleckstrin-like domain
VSEKPNPTSFIGLFVAGFGLLGVIIAVGLAFLNTSLAVVVGIATPLLAYVHRTKQFAKETYTLTDDGIDVTKGTWFSDHEIMVPWERVTTVNYTKPFFERVLFGTGSCHVDSAGSQQSSIVLRHVNDDLPRRVRQELISEDNQDHTVKPNKPAAVAKGAWQGLTSLLGIAVVFFLPAQQQSVGTGPVFIGALIVSLAASAIAATRQIIDDVSLQYETHDDHVRIHGGVFYHRHHVLLASHITDTASNQTVIDRLLDVERISVSVAGGKQEVDLPYVAKEDGFTTHIPRSTSTPSELSEAEDVEDSASEEAAAQCQPDTTRTYTQLFAMTVAISPLLILFPISFLFYAPYAGSLLIRPFVTRYEVDETSTRSTFTFFERNQTVFDKDRVTGVIMKRNPLDYLCNTVTISVQTIGSASRLTFNAVEHDSAFAEAVLSLKDRSTTEHRILPETSLSAVFARFLPLCLMALGVAGGLLGRSLIGWSVAVGGVGVAAFIWAWWRLRYAVLLFGEDRFERRTGAWFYKRVVADYKDVKRLQSTLYPFASVGSATFYLPGGSQASVIPGFTMPCVRNPWQQHNVLEGCAQRNTWSSPMDPGEVTWHDTPFLPAVILRGAAFVGVIVVLGMIGVASGVLSVLAAAAMSVVSVAFLVGYTTWHSQVAYERTPARFIAEKGVLYRSATTVLRNRIDYDDVSRLWYHKLTGTGTVSLYTTGSDEKDLVVDAVRSYRGVTERE